MAALTGLAHKLPLPTFGLKDPAANKEEYKARQIRTAIEVGAVASIFLIRFTFLGRFVPAAIKGFCSNNSAVLKTGAFFTAPGALVLNQAGEWSARGLAHLRTLPWSQVRTEGIRALDRVAGKKIAAAAILLSVGTLFLYKWHNIHKVLKASPVDTFTRNVAGAPTARSEYRRLNNDYQSLRRTHQGCTSAIDQAKAAATEAAEREEKAKKLAESWYNKAQAEEKAKNAANSENTRLTQKVTRNLRQQIRDEEAAKQDAVTARDAALEALKKATEEAKSLAEKLQAAETARDEYKLRLDSLQSASMTSDTATAAAATEN